ncbi:Zinc metalloprotease [Rubellimicrobium mesophilum DSM 19309]|uniref:Zinc metalloprotease n=1 Tax=Rubellimicrobium mesophilum DSM 19309 TaxID=442562 RepID=A0A017HT55_9RHOB|nr:SprT family zinc-dependent metalloprotease [Rubellimicrobium mesophilum]EYD77353.1 Zinc metalloprotease [Rubellimicrobium mesophilum DSM 19309]
MDHILPGDPPVAVSLRRSARARRLSLRISGTDGRVTLTLPLRARLGDGLAFLREREGWLRGHLSRAPVAIVPAFGRAIPFEGREVLLCRTEGGLRLEGDRLLMPGRADGLSGRLAGFLRAAARDRLAAACDRHAAALGRRYRKLTLRDTRSRWGSCTSDGDLMFSWRLVLAPPPVLDYVVAHEVGHLAEMNHSPAFWAVVERLCPGHEGPRDWLRAEGAGLHRLRLN